MEHDALDAGATVAELDARVDKLLEERLAAVSRVAPSFSAALRAYRRATVGGDVAIADGLVAWLAGQPHVAASVKRAANLRGDLDHNGALGFLQGLLVVLRDSGHAGLVLVIDEVETLQRVRSDVRDKALNALRQLVDEVDAGRYPGLVLVVTGTPAFFDGPQGAQRLAPLAQRLHVDFLPDPRFDNPRAVQLRLPGFSRDSLLELGERVRGLYLAGAADSERVGSAVDAAYVAKLADEVSGSLGGRVGVAPRVFVKKLVDVLDRVDQFPEFDPVRDHVVRLVASELSDEERAASGPRRPARAVGVDDIGLDL